MTTPTGLSDATLYELAHFLDDVTFKLLNGASAVTRRQLAEAARDHAGRLRAGLPPEPAPEAEQQVALGAAPAAEVPHAPPADEGNPATAEAAYAHGTPTAPTEDPTTVVTVPDGSPARVTLTPEPVPGDEPAAPRRRRSDGS